MREPSREPSEAEGIGSLLRGVIGDLGVEKKMAQAQAVLSWPEVAGPALAARSQALRVHHAHLEVAVPSAVWRTQLSFVKDDLVRRINERIGSPTIKSIRLVSKP
jgi:hypothetical protein